MKRLLIIMVMILCLGMVACENSKEPTSEPTSEPSGITSEQTESADANDPQVTEKPQAAEETQKEEKEQADSENASGKKYTDGKYLVGEDIKAGLYKVTLTDSITNIGYIERAKDLKMEFDSMIACIYLTGDGYVEILKTDVAVMLEGVSIEKIKLKELKKDIKKEIDDGIYLVGYDLKPGTYKVEVTDTDMEMRCVERLKSVTMDMNDIIAIEVIRGQSYIEISKDDFAIRVQGAKLTYQKK